MDSLGKAVLVTHAGRLGKDGVAALARSDGFGSDWTWHYLARQAGRGKVESVKARRGLFGLGRRGRERFVDVSRPG